MAEVSSVQAGREAGVDAAGLLASLEGVVRGYVRLLVAYSGGIDSTVVAAVGRRVLGREACVAVIGDSLSLPRRELRAAVALAEGLDLELVTVAPKEQEDAGYRANAGDRCFYCKTNLYEELQALAKERGFERIANGTNMNDLGDHRPGLKAAVEAEVVLPLVEAGLDKAGVRAVARHLGLPNADKPAAACLASRIPYGTEVTVERLREVEAAEDALADLGFEGFRVRHHGQVARLEVPVEQLERLMDEGIRERVVRAVKAAGFVYVAVDLEGFRSGSGNVALTLGGQKVGAGG
ncbi:ATP-dependent sacrificial sulfur transferase LarE [Mucisphaera sp.]|uniref:ATP-dependent sacrificial sulfur transferase LarE n=1 Tax=Mucisphaera sp. TaxID=2913024 RepID=UPI003D096A03